ncbi:MAG TPA: transaldolase [Gammaproteobacteria bacterium]
MAVKPSELKQPAHSKLQQLRQITVVVADTGDIEAIRKYRPQDSTTNPSLLLKAAQQPEYADLIRQALEWASKQRGSAAEQIGHAADRLAVLIGKEILNLVPGRVSTEVDARLSFDTRATIDKAHKLIGQYNEFGIANDRILIKIACTWEGIRAAEQLEKQGINCNLTLLFGFVQAVACADAGVYLISPFVGRILDWYKANTGRDYAPAEDPGVQSVARIYGYYKQHGYKTVVMGASFRNTGEIEQLAGCDRLTISPQLMQQLENDAGRLERKLSPDVRFDAEQRYSPDERTFRWQLNEDAMATDKLADGIRRFAEDQIKLETLLKTFART